MNKIKTLKQLADEANELLWQSTDALNLARQDSDKKPVALERDGKMISITEKDLWDEIWNKALTEDQAVEILKPRYPDAFEKSLIANEKAQELNLFAMKEFRFNPQQMTLSAIINLVDSLVEDKLNDKEIK
jgi:hypothetical protein